MGKPNRLHGLEVQTKTLSIRGGLYLNKISHSISSSAEDQKVHKDRSLVYRAIPSEALLHPPVSDTPPKHFKWKANAAEHRRRDVEEVGAPAEELLTAAHRTVQVCSLILELRNYSLHSSRYPDHCSRCIISRLNRIGRRSAQRSVGQAHTLGGPVSPERKR